MTHLWSGSNEPIAYNNFMPDPSLPALLGGSPVRPQGPPAWPPADADVRAALASAVEAGAWGQYHGEQIPALEKELAAFHQVTHALTCASGTLAVEVGLRALGVQVDDEVILAAYDYESNFLTVHALAQSPFLSTFTRIAGSSIRLISKPPSRRERKRSSARICMVGSSPCAR